MPKVVGLARLANRVACLDSRLVSVVAPAGFGKTTVAQAIADRFGATATCDAAGVVDLYGFVREVVHALCRAAPDRAAGFESDLYLHGQPGVTQAQLAGFAVDAWASVDADVVYIFDSLEAIAEQPESLDLLVRLIKASAGRRLILCARPPFPILNSRLIPPNAHLRLGIEDLAFSRDETRALFHPSVNEADLDRIMAVSRGWPMVVMLLVQLARSGQLDRALTETSGATFDDLRDYLVKEVLAALRGPLLEVLIALAATRSVGLDAAFRATDGAATPRVINDLSQRLPLLELRSNGTYSIHPLIVSVLETTAGPVMYRYRVAAAESLRRDSRYLDAARLYLDLNDVSQAAQCLEALAGPYHERNTYVEVEDVMGRMSPEMLRSCPRLWPAFALLRRGVVDIDILIAEALTLRETLRESPDSLEAKQVAAFLISLATHRGQHDLAERVLRDYQPIDENDLSPGNVALLIMEAFRNMLMGRTQGALERYGRLTPLVHNDLLRAYFTLRVDVVLACMRGDFEDALLGLLRALQYAKSSGRASVIAGMAQHRAVVAWLHGDDSEVEARMDEIRRTAATLGSIDYPAIANAWDTGETNELRNMPPRVRASLVLMLAGKATNSDRRRSLLLEAQSAAEDARDLWVQFLIRAAMALDDPARRSEYLDVAEGLAKDIGQQSLLASVASLRDGGAGAPTLQALVRRFASKAEGTQKPSLILVNVLSRTVYRGEERLTISNRALSLIIILAILGKVPRDVLVDMLWGEETDPESNALSMLVSRARRQLGDPSLIAVTNGLYSLRDDVVVDFHQIQRLVGSLSPTSPLTDRQRDELRSVYERFKPAWLTKESSPSIDAAISAVRHRVVERLAQDALDRGELADAFALAEELRRADSASEIAYELLIRTYVRSGNNAGALREYRAYSEHLMQDLGVAPSLSMEELLQS